MRSCRSPRGECGLKYYVKLERVGYQGRSPRGECGLKLFSIVMLLFPEGVAPLAGSVD